MNAESTATQNPESASTPQPPVSSQGLATLQAWLVRRQDGSTIPLAAGDTVLGRGPVTAIKNPVCSRRQAQFTFEPSTGQVTLVQLGRNPCKVNGQLTAQGQPTALSDGDAVSLMPTLKPMYHLRVDRVAGQAPSAPPSISPPAVQGPMGTQWASSSRANRPPSHVPSRPASILTATGQGPSSILGATMPPSQTNHHPATVHPDAARQPPDLASSTQQATDEPSDLDSFKDPLYTGQTRQPAPGFLDVLIGYVMQPERHREDIYACDSACVVVRDKYPKARQHLLVIPRRPIDYPNNLTAGDLPLLRHMLARGQWVADRLQAEQPNLKFRLGFHSVPSIRQLHMHVISQDFDSACLKHKKHWNSFTTSFFVDATRVIEHIEKYGYVHFEREKFEKHLKDDLLCHVCRRQQKNMPALKAHIATHT